MLSRIERVAPAIAVALVLGGVMLGGSSSAAEQGSDNTSPMHLLGTTEASAQRPTDRAEARIADIHAKLHVTATQDPQWTAFVQAERDSAKEMSALIEQREQHAKSMSAVDDFRSYGKIAEAHEDGLKKIIPAFEALYDSLSDDQKKAADTMFRDSGRRAS